MIKYSAKIMQRIRPFILGLSFLMGISYADPAWVLQLEYKDGQVSLIEKAKIEAKLKSKRSQPSEAEYIATHTSEFGFIVKDANGRIIKTHQGHLPGKIHADFAKEGDRHFEEHFSVIDTFQVIIPALDGSTIEFLSREPEQGAKALQEQRKLQGSGGSADSPAKLPLRNIGKVEL